MSGIIHPNSPVKSAFELELKPVAVNGLPHIRMSFSRPMTELTMPAAQAGNIAAAIQGIIADLARMPDDARCLECSASLTPGEVGLLCDSCRKTAGAALRATVTEPPVRIAVTAQDVSETSGIYDPSALTQEGK